MLVRDRVVDVHAEGAGRREQLGHVGMQGHRFIPSRTACPVCIGTGCHVGVMGGDVQDEPDRARRAPLHDPGRRHDGNRPCRGSPAPPAAADLRHPAASRERAAGTPGNVGRG